MWTHYCTVDRAWISVGKNEPCNWCGAEEKSHKNDKHKTQTMDEKWNPEHSSLKRLTE